MDNIHIIHKNETPNNICLILKNEDATNRFVYKSHGMSHWCRKYINETDCEVKIIINTSEGKWHKEYQMKPSSKFETYGSGFFTDPYIESIDFYISNNSEKKHINISGYHTDYSIVYKTI